MSVSKVWAIDLGHSAIKAALVVSDGDGVKVLDAAIVSLPPASGHGEELCRDMRVWKALEGLESRYRISKYPVALSIPPENTLIREIDITLLRKRSLEQLVYFEALNAIPYVLDDVVWDYHIFASELEQKPGANFTGLIFAAKKSSVHAYIQSFSDVVTDTIVDMILSPMGILGLMHFERPENASCLGIDIGESGCSMVGLCDDTFWMRNIATGSRHVTEILAERFEIGFEQAEQAKKNISASPVAKEMMGIVNPGINDLVRKLKVSIEYMDRAEKKTHFDKVYVFGGGRRLPGMKEKIHRLSGQTGWSLSDFSRITLSSGADRREVMGNIDRLAVALGAGIKALGKTPFEFSFAPRAAARGASLVGKKPVAIAAALFLWLVLGGLFFAITFAESRLQDAVVSANVAAWQYTEQNHKFAELTDLEGIKAELDWLLALPEGRAQAAEIVSEVGVVFAEANESDGLQSSFKIRNLHIARSESDGEPGSRPEFDVNIYAGVRGEGLEESVALREMRLAILDNLSYRSTLSRMRGVAQFTKNEEKMEIVGAHQDKRLQAGDRIYIENDGVFYEVKKVVSGSEFLLDRAYAEDDSESFFIATRCRMESWGHEDLTFRIWLSTPAEGVFSLSIR